MTGILVPLDAAHERSLLLTLAGIQFAHILDFMIMMPLGPILMRELGVGTHEFGLLVSAYTLTAAFSGLLAAVFVDRFERKRFLLGTFACFALATLACGLAFGYWTLLVARGMAGAFGGVLSAMIHTMVGDLIPFERRGRASGTLMSAFSLSTVAGVPFSLFLANHLSWRSPFILIAALTGGFLLLGVNKLPRMYGHLVTATDTGRQHPLSVMYRVLSDPNHLRALTLMVLLMFSGFTVIPYITIYITANVGVAQESIPLIYLVAGCVTFFTSRLIGHLADTYGKVRIYRLIALMSIVPLFVQTHLVPVPLWLVMVCSTLFFILVPGRMVPAMAIITSVAQSRWRGTFLSMNGAVQQLSAGAAAYLSGAMIGSDAHGRIVGYGMVGYLAIAITLVALVFVGRIRMDTGEAAV